MTPDDSEALLDLLIAQEIGDTQTRDTIPRTPRDRPLPLSFPQQRLWFLHEMGITGNAYTIPINLRLRGALDAPALARTLTAITARHDVLRTVFRSRDGEPEQRILPPADLLLPIAEIAPAQLEAAIDAHNETPFDLASGPILRAALLRLAPGDHVLLLAVHHIAFDGWSVGLFVTELTTLYRAFRAGAPDPFPPLPIQYADFAAWQRRALDDTPAKSAIAYWRRQLAGAAPVTLPPDHPRPAILGFRGGRCEFHLPPEILAGLERLGRDRGATLFMVLSAAFAALMHRYSGEPRIAIGTPVAGRDRAEIEPLVGFFVNSVVLAIDLDGEPGFTTLLDRVRDTALDAYAHAHIPFETLVEALAPERGLDRNPLFQVMFALQQPEAMAPDLALEGLSATPIPFTRITARFDLELHAWPARGALDGICTFNLDLYAAPTVERMLGHLAALLRAIVAEPRRPISELPMLTGADAPPEAPSPPAPTLCLHQSLSEAAAKTPDALALVFDGRPTTLVELDRRANRIAHLLRAHGAGPETLVSLCMDRGDAMIAAFLGIWKAGACYLPIDPAEPPDRLAFILADSQAALHLTESRHAQLFANATGPVLALDTMPLDTQPGTDPAIPTGPDNLAYIIYTSGSTGRPKGVEGRHGTIANLVAWHRRAHPHPPLRTLQYAQYSFDIFFQELFGSWLEAAPCYMVTEPMRRDMHALAAFVVQHRIERIFMPFAPLQYLLEILTRHDTPFLQEVTTAGEQLQSTPPVRAFFAANPQARLHNHYGPTECYVVAAHTLPTDPATWPDLPPVGRPVDRVRITLVDRHLASVPQGVAGEILIAGAQLSRGYRNRPAQTAAAFIPDPAGNPGARLYRTGDLGRRRPDGTIEFLGRMDRQLKIRGFRIEPGEVEVALSRHPGVKQALATAHRFGGGDMRLVAYVVPNPGAAPTEAILRAWLQSRLPRQMVPNAIILLDAMPLNVSGKIDRHALPPPIPAPAAQPGAARSPREQAIAEIFADLLRRDRVDPHDNFFDLGGHSLLATRVVARLRAALGIELPLVRLFETPTVAGIAAWAATQHATAEPIPALNAVTAPASFAQRRLWLLDQLGTTGAAYLMPVNLRLTGRLDIPALERSLAAIVARHATLRTTIDANDGHPTQRIHPPSRPQESAGPHSLSRLRERVGVRAPGANSSRRPEQEPTPFTLPIQDATPAELPALAHAANTTPFDLATQPPFRARLIRLESEHHALLATFHHVACDGWSVMVFFRELAALYEAFTQDRPDPLPALPIQYADYAAWQHRTLTPDTIAAHIAHWRPLLDGLAPLRLPTDRRRPATEAFRGAGLRFTIHPHVAAGLRALAQSEGATLYMVLLAATIALMHRFTGDERIAIGTPVANRDRAEVEGLIGFFVNALVMTADIHPADPFRALLARVRRTVLDAFAHDALPFETLVEALAPVRDLSRNPLFQVLFALQQPEAMTARLLLPGLEATPLDATEATVRFDLEFHVWPHGAALQGFVAYDRDLFDTPTIEALLASLQSLLAAAAEAPETQIATLPLLEKPSPLGRGLGEGASVHRALPAEAPTTLHAIPRTNPHATAITAGAQSLTYAQLEDQSDRLAAHILSLDLPPNSPIALLMQRTAALPMAMLAILKAGHAYVPLEPRQPPDRLRFILDDTRSPLVITDEANRPGALLLEGAPTWNKAPLPTVHPDAIAYVIYTSGSTGTPKGVQVSHRAARRLFTATQPLFDFGPHDVWTCFHSAAFDFSVWEIWGALLHGGRVVMVPHETARTPETFLALLAEQRVTVLNQTPSAFAQLAEAQLDHPRPLALRWVVFGGEALDTTTLRRWFARFGDTAPRLVNCYGITETTVHVTLRPLSLADLDLPFHSPIGAAIPDLTLRILDPDLSPVPDRAPGELCIAGPGLARGYLGQPALTAARFVPDPSGPPGARMYRSGDLVRRRGTDLEYLRRIDTQIKLRGYRIETNEITARLRAHPAIADAATLLRDGQLVSYVTPAADRTRDDARTEDWRRVFDEQLARDGGDWEDPLFRLTGWLASDTRAPIPPAQMQAWADGTVTQIKALSPRRVLEIGCGTGILLFRLAESVERYHGIDFSRESLAHVQAQLDRHTPRFHNVTIEQRPAQSIAALPHAAYDTIVVNSVVQYFPSLETLRTLIRDALPLLAPGGAIYVGDVRDLRLAGHFHAWVLAARDPANPGIPDQARQAAAAERELLIDPAFFTSLADEGIHSAALLLQQGDTTNELNRYRYAALLRPIPAPEPPRPVTLPNPRLSATGTPPAWSAPNLDDPTLIDSWPTLTWRPTTATPPPRPLASDPTRHQALVEAIPTLKRDLATFLPDYMIPAHIVVLDTLPLTVNGKLDTRALPYATQAVTRKATATPPATQSEHAVAALFTELLGNPDNDIDDDFFALGGHSLLATRLCARIRQRFTVEMPLIRVFETPTIRGLAAHLDAALMAQTGQGDAADDRTEGEI